MVFVEIAFPGALLAGGSFRGNGVPFSVSPLNFNRSLKAFFVQVMLPVNWACC